MPAHFKSLPLFSSGPARFSVMSQGLVVLSNLSLGTTDPNTFPIGARELDVVVTGRLVASSESDPREVVRAFAIDLANASRRWSRLRINRPMMDWISSKA